jgi:ribose-phosphate pyrophosphokinase
MARGDSNSIKVFAGVRSIALTELICDRLDLPLGIGRTESFPDSELIVKIEEDVRGRDCFVVLSTSNPVNRNLMELLIFIDCLKRASVARVTAVIPYYGYARQDRKDEGRTPITAKLVANMITTSGADRVLTLDLHAAQIQGFFDIPVDHMSASPVFLRYFLSIREELGDLVLVSPDVGNVKVSGKYAAFLDGEIAFIDKRRISGTKVNSSAIIGDVRNKTVLMMDDMISTAGTVCEAARLVMDNGAKRVLVGATHGVLVGPAMDRLIDSPISRIILTDTIPLGDRIDPIRGKVVELSVGDLLGDAIHNIHHNLSVSALFRKDAGSKR